MDGYAFDTQTDELYKKQGVDRMSVRVVIATHKPCAVPSDPLYLPLCVGVATAAPTGFAGDDTGESITEKNSTFCELTGLYWAWKNLPDDYIGLVHYRRYFSTHRCFRYRRALRQVLTLEQAQSLLQGRDGILPRPRRYYIETLYSHYAHTSYEEPLAETGRILQERYPAYYPAFQRLHRRTAAHMFNMMIWMPIAPGCSIFCLSWSSGWIPPAIPSFTHGSSGGSASCCWMYGWSSTRWIASSCRWSAPSAPLGCGKAGRSSPLNLPGGNMRRAFEFVMRRGKREKRGVLTGQSTISAAKPSAKPEVFYC